MENDRERERERRLVDWRTNWEVGVRDRPYVWQGQHDSYYTPAECCGASFGTRGGLLHARLTTPLHADSICVVLCVSVLFLIPSHLIAFFVPTLHTHTHTIFLIFQMRNAEFLGCNFIFAVCVLFILFRLGYYLFVKEILWKHAILSLPVHLCNYQKGPPRFSSLFWSLVKKKKRSL
jgi:hypothetical protein